MPKRSRKALRIESCVKHFLKEYRKHSHLDEKYGGAYYWNERDIQWALYSHLRERAVQRSIGSKWSVHAEGRVERPKYARKNKWPGTRRADIVIINHDAFKRAWRDGADFPPYEMMIEIKMVWPGWGPKFYRNSIKRDIEKLESCLSSGITKEAIFILLDGLDRNGIPYYNEKDLQDLKKNSNLIIYHWPDSKKPVDYVKDADFRRY